MSQQYACGNGHQMMAWYRGGEPADLEGFLCPLCLGRVNGYETMIDPNLLAPVQA
jgi:hypothetical protein